MSSAEMTLHREVTAPRRWSRNGDAKMSRTEYKFVQVKGQCCSATVKVQWPHVTDLVVVMVHFTVSHFTVCHLAISHFAVSHYLTLSLTPNSNPIPIPRPSNSNTNTDSNPNPTPRKWEMVKWEW